MKTDRRQWLGASVTAVAGSLVVLGPASGQKKASGGLHFELYKDAKDEFRWRLKAANGQVLATSGDGYKAKADCQHGIEVIQKEASKAKVLDLTTKK